MGGSRRLFANRVLVSLQLSARWRRFLTLPSKRRLKGYLASLLALLVIKAFWYSAFVLDAEQVLSGSCSDLMERRAFLVRELRDPEVLLKAMPSGLPPQFQGEWAIVSYSMTSMALANLAQLSPETRAESARLVSALAEQVLAEPIRRFDRERWEEDPIDTLESARGHIGYLGHLNLVLAAESYLSERPAHGELFGRVSRALARRIEACPSGLESTYPGELYVADNAVVIASLGLYYKLHPEEDRGLVGRWLAKMERLREPSTGFLPFQLSDAGEVLQPGRGSGEAWTIFYLSYADQDWAKAQFARVKEHLYQPLLVGMAGIREYPVGVGGHGDVDSGPIILGASPAGTGFALAGARLTGDRDFLQRMLRTSEFVGFTWAWDGRRQYLLAPLVGDAIMLAMLTATPWAVVPREG